MKRSAKRLKSGRTIIDPIPWESLTDAEVAEVWGKLKPFQIIQQSHEVDEDGQKLGTTTVTRKPTLVEIAEKQAALDAIQTRQQDLEKREQRHIAAKLAKEAKTRAKADREAATTGSPKQVELRSKRKKASKKS